MREAPPPDWCFPSRTLIIATTGRTGSHLLCEKLAGTAVLGRPAEFFNPWVRSGLSVVDRCRWIAEEGMTPNGVAAFRLGTRHFSVLQKSIDLQEWFPDPVWVHLTRRDILAQAISLVIATQTKAWTANDDPSGEAVYSHGEIEQAILRITGERALWDGYFARNGIAPLRLVYEDIIDDFDAVCADIARRLSVQVQLPPTAPTQLSQQRTTRNDEWRARFLAEADPSRLRGPQAAAKPAAKSRQRWWTRLLRR